MAKYNVDDILSELGVGSKKDPAKRPAAPKPGDGRGHTIDQAEASFSPLPAMPANQGAAPPASGAAPDPAVKEATKHAAPTTVGRAITDLYSPDSPAPARSTKELGEYLLELGATTPERLQSALAAVKATPTKRLSDALIDQGVDEIAVHRAMAELAGAPFERIDLDKGLDGGFDGKMTQRLGIEFCKSKLVIPLRTEGTRLVVASTRPDDVFIVDEIKAKLGVPGVKLVVTAPYDVRGALEIMGASTQSDINLDDVLADVTDSDVQLEKSKTEEVDLESAAADGPVIKCVNAIIQRALKEGASDIHIEPGEKKLKVRFRIDGDLFDMPAPPASMSAAITSRLKIMANLDISERRLPQDGRIRCQVGGRKLDLRMSTLPNAWGEKTVMRILDQRSISVELEQLGFDEQTYEIWRKSVDSPHGIVLVTGPTGSGKTTTLYASLRKLDRATMNVCTVEDPIEYNLDGITQTQMHEKIGMTFAVALRSLLRQDPDVIMLGEIRDHETAHIAVQAALTGHLVLSTLHTNDAPASITRLVNIGLEPFLVGAAVNAVLAQRLVRRICGQCKSLEKPSEEMQEFLALQGMDPDEIWVPKGCDKCRKTGYSGRVGIYELLTVDDQLRDVIARNPNVAEFRRICIERGMVTLHNDGLRKVAKGLTTVQEIMRVTEASH